MSYSTWLKEQPQEGEAFQLGNQVILLPNISAYLKGGVYNLNSIYNAVAMFTFCPVPQGEVGPSISGRQHQENKTPICS